MNKIISFLIFCFLFLLIPSQISAQVVINEFISNANPEWVELYNSSSSAEYLKNYWLDDDTDFVGDSGTSSKKSLIDLNINNPTFPYIEMHSFLNNPGDFVVLFNPNGEIVDQYQYASDPGDGVSIGRNPDRNGEFNILTTSTKGEPNSSPLSPILTDTPTPTNTLTPTSVPSATKTPTPKPTTKIVNTPTFTPKLLTKEQETIGQVLGQQQSVNPSSSSSDNLKETTKQGLITGAKISLVLGLLFCGIAIMVFTQRMQQLNKKNEKN